jgi:hypothetical protein
MPVPWSFYREFKKQLHRLPSYQEVRFAALEYHRFYSFLRDRRLDRERIAGPGGPTGKVNKLIFK